MYLKPTDERIWLLRGFAPNRIVSYSRWTKGPLNLFPLWASDPTKLAPDASQLPYCTYFPPEWTDVVAFHTDVGEYWNKEHPLVQLIRQENVVWLGTHCPGGDPRNVASELLEDRGRTAAWIVDNIFKGQNFWDGVRDNLPDFWVTLMDELLAVTELPVRAGTSMRTITVERSGKRTEWNSLPLPRGEDWTLEEMGTPDTAANSRRRPR